MTPSDTSPPATPRTHPYFWLAHVGYWLAFGTIWYFSALAHGKHASYWNVCAATAFTGAVMTLGLRALLRGLWDWPPQRLILAMIVPVLLASASMGVVNMLTLFRWCGESCMPPSSLAYGAYLINHVYALMTWVGMYVGINTYRELQRQTRQALAADAMAHHAQLKMLRYQLNPHFLFNTLNAISTLILDRDGTTANRMVQSLSAFLRHSLDNDPLQRVTLKQELDSLRLYLDIEKVRFAERLRIEYTIEPECYSALMPGLLLQPLIENAIKHAVAKSIEGGQLEIGARRVEGMLELRVADDGPGSPNFDASASAGTGNGVGLANTRQRLLVLYGARQRFDAHNRPDGCGSEILVQLPFEIGGAPRE